MLLHRLLQAAVVLLIIFAGYTAYNHFFNADDTLDHRLAKRAMEKMIDRDDVFKNRITGMKLVEPGVYNLQTEGLETAHEAGNIAFNAMTNFINTKYEMQASRHTFTFFGYDDGELIFEVTNSDFDEPVVILHGRFEGEEYSPLFGPQTSAPPSVESETESFGNISAEDNKLPFYA